MQSTTSARISAGLLAMAATVVGATTALAAPNDSGSVVIEEPNGFPGVCAQPCYTVTKGFELWLPDNPDNPLPLAGNNTYIYKLTHDGGPGPFVPAVTAFDMVVDTSMITAVGHLATSPGVAPQAAIIDTVNGVVSWKFAPPLFSG